MVDQEGTASSLQELRDVVATYGLFCALYTDRGSHYFYTPEAGGKISKTMLTEDDADAGWACVEPAWH